jgi:hypothetical protein
MVLGCVASLPFHQPKKILFLFLVKGKDFNSWVENGV